MSTGRIGGSYFAFVGATDTLTYATPLSAAVTPGTSGAYSSYVQLVAAASNTFERYVTGVGLQSTAGVGVAGISNLNIKIAIGGAGAEVDIATIPLAWSFFYSGSSVGWPGANIPLMPPLVISSGVRISAAVAHAGAGSIGACRIVASNVDTSAVVL